MKKLILLLFILVTFLVLTSCDKDAPEDESSSEAATSTKETTNVDESKENIETVGLKISQDQLNKTGLSLGELEKIYNSDKAYKFGNYILFQNNAEQSVLMSVDQSSFTVSDIKIYSGKETLAYDDFSLITNQMTIGEVIERIGFPIGVSINRISDDEYKYVFNYRYNEQSYIPDKYVIFDFNGKLVDVLNTDIEMSE